MSARERQAFGIGCFHLGPPSPLTEGLTWGRHFANVTRAVEGMSSVSDLRVDYDEEMEHAPVLKSAGPRRLQKGGGATPPSRASIAFAVHVPASFQRTQVPWTEPVTEDYFVLMLYPYYAPVTFVLSAHPDDDFPARGVMLVREFLDDRLKDSPDVSFEFLGPSPFHADCYLSPSEETRSRHSLSAGTKPRL